MNNKALQLTLFAALALALVGGCAKSEPVAPAAPAPEPRPAAKGAALGTMVRGHYDVMLTSTPAVLKVGKTKFTAVISHHGQPASGVIVKLTTHMPTMGHDGPGAALTAVRPGVFEGEVDLPMAGDYDAKVLMDTRGDKGEASFSFTVPK